MLYSIIGDVGAGKSAYLVERVILPALAQGREVWTNVKVRGALADNPLCRHFTNFADVVPIVRIDGEMSDDDDRVSPGALLVIDEAGIQLGAGFDTQSKAYTRMRRYFAQHRHFCDSAGRSTDIFLAAQDTSQLTSQASALVSFTILLRSLRVLFGFKRGTEYRLFHGALSRDDIQRRSRSDGGGTSTIARGLFFPKPSTFALYDSHDIASDVAGIEMMAVKPALSSRFLMLAALVCFIAVSVGFATSSFDGILSPNVAAAPPAPPVNYRLAGWRDFRGTRSVCYADGTGAIVACRHIQYRRAAPSGIGAFHERPAVVNAPAAL